MYILLPVDVCSTAHVAQISGAQNNYTSCMQIMWISNMYASFASFKTKMATTYRDGDLLEVVVGQLQVDMSQGVKCRGQGAGSCFLQVEPHGD